MGDRVTVYMTFGGKLKRSALPEFIELLEGECFASNENSSGDYPLELALLDGHQLHAHEVNYANTEAIDEFCIEHGLSFDKYHDEGGGFGAGIIRLRDGEAESMPAAEGEPMIPLSKILEVETLATGLADLIALAKRWSGDDLPEFEIVEDT